MMDLIKAYEAAIARGEIQDDAKQRQVLVAMQRLRDDLNRPKPFWRRKRELTGIYLYGPVGVGKTYLMDLFYQQVEESKKARFHFHHFMQQVDAQLRQRQGQKDPLRKIAADLSKGIRLLCFDEFLVHDVAYAMILAELLQALVAKGIVFVVTSNVHPDDLYRKGVHRERFLPVIDLMKTRSEVIHLVHQKDYRFDRGLLLQAYLYPLNARTEAILSEQFVSLTQEVYKKGSLQVQNRDIPFIKCGEQVVWFDFKVICNLPRSHLDYLEIADRFDTVFISGIPALTARDTLFAILLIHFIDVLYDRGIKLIVSAEVPLEQLYVEGEMTYEFRRTYSRLQEMQAADYLRRHPWRHEQNLAGFI